MKKRIIIGMSIFAITLFLFPSFSENIYLTAIDIFLWLGAGGVSFAIMQVIVTHLSEEARGTVVAVNNSFMWTGTALGSAIVS